MKKYDVLVVGELNVDLILNNLQDFPEIGKEIIAGEMELTLGSSSAIFASNLATLGSRVAFLGIVGNDDFGKQVIAALENKNVSTEFVIRSSKYKTGATIALNFGEDRAMVTFPGAMEHLNTADVSSRILQNCGHLHISSVFLQPGIKDHLPEIYSEAKKLGLTTSLDTQWDPQEIWDISLNRTLPLVDVFFPNKQELLALTGTHDVSAALGNLEGKANIIAVKMGRDGALGMEGNDKLKVESFVNPDVVDAIGAGDSFNAGFIFEYLSHKRLEQCLLFGNLMGAINTTAPGGTGAFSNIEAVNRIAKEKFNFLINN